MMLKKTALLMLILSFFGSAYAVELSLKNKISVVENRISLYDVINEPIPSEIGDIELANPGYYPYRMNNDEIADKLIERGYKDLIIKGTEIIIYRLKSYKDTGSLPEKIKKDGKNPVKFLEEQLSSYVDKSKYRIKINVTGSVPSFIMDSISEDFVWELGRFNSALKDIAGIKKIVLKDGERKYDVSLDVCIYANVFLARRSFKKGELFKNDFFYAKNVDITLYKDPDDLVLDPAKAYDTRFYGQTGSGEVLRWSNLSRNPVVVKDQNLKILINKKGFNIAVNCKAMDDCFENEKLKVKLENGREKTGVLRKMNGECYVEML